MEPEVATYPFFQNILSLADQCLTAPPSMAQPLFKVVLGSGAQEGQTAARWKTSSCAASAPSTASNCSVSRRRGSWPAPSASSACPDNCWMHGGPAWRAPAPVHHYPTLSYKSAVAYALCKAPRS